ncbi:MAG: hypothetical protein ABUL67_02295, partial [Haliangium ochraceum]
MTKEEFFAAAGPVTALPSWRATPGQLRRAFARQEAQAVLAELQGETAHATLLALVALVEGERTGELARHTPVTALMSAVLSALDAGRLILVEGWEFTGDHDHDRDGPRAGRHDAPTDVATTLAQRIMGTQSEIVFEGRRYRLRGSRASSMASARRGYQPVSPTEMRAVIKRMAARVPTTPEQKQTWAELLTLVDETKEDSRDGGGLVLLRFVPRSAAGAPATASPATTPSQLLAQVAPEDWIELQIFYDDDTPFDGNC